MTFNTVKVVMEQPTIKQKTVAAIFISTHGANFTGVRTKATLMWPIKKFTNVQTEKEASSFLGSVHIALLESLPPERLKLILKDQDERLSFNGE